MLSARELLALVVFVAVQIAFLPLAVVGLVLLSFRQIWVSRRLGVSATATSVIGNRWVMDRFDTRPDPITRRLYGHLPNGSELGLWLLVFPSYLHYRISGRPSRLFLFDPEGQENPAKLAFARSLYFDRLIARSIGNVRQMVTLGAGDDTRSFGSLQRPRVHFFELDEPRTQQLKVEALRKARIPTPHVTFVPVKFDLQEWSEPLIAAGFQPAAPALFLCEGVTPYLEESAVRDILRTFRALAAPGSVLLLDIYDKATLVQLRGVKATHESFVFGLDLAKNTLDTVRSFLQSEDCVLGETYLMGRATKRGTFGVVCEVAPHGIPASA